MGKQHNKVLKRRRRATYLKRKKQKTAKAGTARKAATAPA